MALVFVSAAWLLGMANVGLWSGPWWMVGAWIGGLAPAVILRGSRRSQVTLALAAVAGLAGGHHFAAWENRPSPELAAYVGSSGTFAGVVDSPPDPGLTTAAYEIKVAAMEGRSLSGGGKVRITVGQYERLLPGTRLRLSGKLEEPPVFEEFDYRGYLARRGVVATLYFPKVEVLGEPGRWDAQAHLTRMRLRLERSLQRSLPEPESSLGAGIAFGLDGNISDEEYDRYRATGLAHIIAVSGSNVTFVTAVAFMLLVPLVGRRKAIFPACLLVLGYVAVAGLAPSVVRAGLMATVFLAGSYLGRQQSSLGALGLAAMVMTGWSPGFLQQVGLEFGPQVALDVGFQLSLAATAGLIAFGPWIRWAVLAARARWRVLRVVPEWVGDVVALTLSATVATLPLVWANFGQVSLVGPVANLVVEPFFVVALGLTALTAVAGVVWEPLGWFVGLAAFYALGFITWFNRTLAAVPHASLDLPRGVGDAMALWYFAMAAAAWPLYRHLPPQVDRVGSYITSGTNRRVALIALACAVGLMAVPVSLLPMRGPGELQVSFLDVGQGDSILVTTPGGRTVLVDGGPSGIGVARELGEVLPHWKRRIDLVVLTHPQEDHLAGLVHVTGRYDVADRWDSGEKATSAAWARYVADDSPRRQVRAGESFVLDGVTFTVLWPPPGFESRGVNELSVVVKVTYGATTLLLTGDFEAESQAALMASNDVSADVLKVPHHGSKTSSSTFLRTVDPAVAVISVGAKNRYGHPNQETLDALGASVVLRTDRMGRVTVRSDGKRIEYRTER